MLAFASRLIVLLIVLSLSVGCRNNQESSPRKRENTVLELPNLKFDENLVPRWPTEIVVGEAMTNGYTVNFLATFPESADAFEGVPMVNLEVSNGNGKIIQNWGGMGEKVDEGFRFFGNSGRLPAGDHDYRMTVLLDDTETVLEGRVTVKGEASDEE